MATSATYTVQGRETVRNALSAKEKFLFLSYLQAHYAESKCYDVAFAEQASKALNLPISASMVSYARREFAIPGNKQHSGKGAQLTELLSRVETLEAKMETLLRERREGFHHGVPHK